MKISELKKLQALCDVDYGMDLVACIKQRIDKAETAKEEAIAWGKIGYKQADEEYKKGLLLTEELSRVRGLLQRGIPKFKELLRDSDPLAETKHKNNAHISETCDVCWLKEAGLACAESVDIGELDTADKKEFLYNPPCPKCGGKGIISKPHEFGNVYCYCIEQAQREK